MQFYFFYISIKGEWYINKEILLTYIKNINIVYIYTFVTNAYMMTLYLNVPNDDRFHSVFIMLFRIVEKLHANY